MKDILMCASNTMLCGTGTVPECATRALRGCVRLPSKEAGRNLIMSCQSLALNSPALHACSAHAPPDAVRSKPPRSHATPASEEIVLCVLVHGTHAHAGCC